MKIIIRRVAALVIGLGFGVGALAGLEVVTHISDLNASWPLGSDLASTADDHIRNIKTALKTDFPNVNAAVTPTPTQFNQLTTDTFTNVAVSSSAVAANGIYLPSANTLGFSTNTTARGSINSAGNWSVSAPSSGTALSVALASPSAAGDRGVALSITGADARLGIQTTTSGNAQVNLDTVGAANWTIANRRSDGAIVFSNDQSVTTPRATLSTAGNLTIPVPTSGSAFLASGFGSAFTAIFTGASSAGTSYGLRVNSGTNSSDFAFLVDNQAGGVDYFRVLGDGSITGRGSTAGALVDMSPDKGTFTITGTGFSSATTATATWAKNGLLVSIFIPALSNTSNATTFTLTGIPSAIQPATLTQQTPLLLGRDNGTTISTMTVTITAASGTWTVNNAFSTSAFTASGTKQLGGTTGVAFTYSLQ